MQEETGIVGAIRASTGMEANAIRSSTGHEPQSTLDAEAKFESQDTHR
jgi:hypothetical protein